jgi:hypothetical protein
MSRKTRGRGHVSVSKRSNKRKPPVPAVGRRPEGRVRLVAVLASVCALLTAGYAATRYDAVRRAVGMRPLLAPAASVSQQGQLPLARENVYVGGRLVAIEEPMTAATPTPTPAGPAPANLRATATSASAVHLKWDAASGAVGYVVERTSAPGVQPVETPTGSAAPAFDDAVPAGDNAYLYRVKAVYGGGYSAYGNYDLAATVIFTDDPLRPKATLIKAAHLTELRRAVNAVRALAGVSTPASWTYPDPVSPPQGPRRKIYPEDVQELRDRLDEALGRLNLAAPYPADPPVARGARVYAAHFEQIRARVK